MSIGRFPWRPALAVAVAVAVMAPGPLAARPRTRDFPSVTRGPADALTQALRKGEVTPAEYALERARSLFALERVRRRFGRVARPDPKSATLLLRDLALSLGQLKDEDRSRARRLLARPTDNGPGGGFDVRYSSPAFDACSEHMCFHWVERQNDGDAPADVDGDGDGLRDWVETTMGVFEEVWVHEIETLGYRPPKSDATSTNDEGDPRLDVYLANLGDDGLYGFCTSDDPNLNRLGTSGYPYWDVSAYCVVDNDYDPAEYPAQTPLGNLQVTAAHEFFHASQFAYDVSEDAWLMEGSAVWMEDEVYDDIDDNHQFLQMSALTRPGTPLDLTNDNFGSDEFLLRYGAWLLFRFAEERLGNDPAVVREIWERADASPVQEYGDRFSLRAVAGAVAARGLKFKELFADFGAANFFPELFYEEGAAYLAAVGRPPATRNISLSAAKPKTGWRSARAAHLSSRYFVIKRGSGVGADARLRVTLDLPARKRSQRATVSIEKESGAVEWRRPRLDRSGDAIVRVAFGGDVERVVLVLTGASPKMVGCFRGGAYSCQGTPANHLLTHRYKVAVI